ncbi:hypothetical protein IWX49DRAFT_112868 [Phyllosticta citricarpa]
MDATARRFHLLHARRRRAVARVVVCLSRARSGGHWGWGWVSGPSQGRSKNETAAESAAGMPTPGMEEQQDLPRWNCGQTFASTRRTRRATRREPCQSRSSTASVWRVAIASASLLRRRLSRSMSRSPTRLLLLAPQALLRGAGAASLQGKWKGDGEMATEIVMRGRVGRRVRRSWFQVWRCEVRRWIDKMDWVGLAFGRRQVWTVGAGSFKAILGVCWCRILGTLMGLMLKKSRIFSLDSILASKLSTGDWQSSLSSSGL